MYIYKRGLLGCLLGFLASGPETLRAQLACLHRVQCGGDLSKSIHRSTIGICVGSYSAMFKNRLGLADDWNFMDIFHVQ